MELMPCQPWGIAGMEFKISKDWEEFWKVFPLQDQVPPRPRQASYLSDAADPLDYLVDRPKIFRRNAVSYMAAKTWRQGIKPQQIEAMRQAKRTCEWPTLTKASVDICAMMSGLFGKPSDILVTSIPCGHSRVANCFSTRLGQSVAAALGLPFEPVWAHRFLNGSSHPTQSRKLPPLKRLFDPVGPVIVIDDIISTGTHMEQALLDLRRTGNVASGFAWISGSTFGEPRASLNLGIESKSARPTMERLVSDLIDLLDTIEGDTDLEVEPDEANGDDEPDLDFD